MSIVIGLKHNNKIYMASDSQITSDGRKRINRAKQTKMWHPQSLSHIIMGSVGWVRERNLMQTANNLFSQDTLDKRDSIGYHSIITQTIPQMLKTIEENRALPERKSQQTVSNNYLIGVLDRLYELDSDLSLIEMSDYAAIGSGSIDALSYLYHTEIVDPKLSLIRAIQAAKNQGIYVDFPVVIMTTEDTKAEVFHSEEDYFEEYKLQKAKEE